MNSPKHHKKADDDARNCGRAETASRAARGETPGRLRLSQQTENPMSASDTKPGRLFNINDVCAHTSLGRTTIYRLIKKNRFPAGTMLTPNRRVWCERDIDQWARSHFDPAPH